MIPIDMYMRVYISIGIIQIYITRPKHLCKNTPDQSVHVQEEEKLICIRTLWREREREREREIDFEILI